MNDDDTTYEIVRFFQNSQEVLATGLSLEEAKEHCKDPETSSRTCTDEALRDLTRSVGAWFDGYREE